MGEIDKVIDILVKSMEVQRVQSMGELETLRAEMNAGFNRTHERLDEVVQAGYITRVECEGYRSHCKRGGVPGYTAFLLVVVSILLTYLFSTI